MVQRPHFRDGLRQQGVAAAPPGFCSARRPALPALQIITSAIDTDVVRAIGNRESRNSRAWNAIFDCQLTPIYPVFIIQERGIMLKERQETLERALESAVSRALREALMLLKA